MDCPSENDLVELLSSQRAGAASGGRESVVAHVDGCALCQAILAAMTDPGPSVPRTSFFGHIRPPVPGELFADRYRIRESIGTGASGVVFAALDERLDRAVAIKVLRAPAGGLDPEGSARLVQESRAMARLRDPHVVTVYDAGSTGEHLWVAMELVEGDNLRRWLHAGPRTVAEIVAVLRQAAQGLAAAHRAGVIHRDFKPDNVLVDAQGRAYVTDFGLANILAEAVGGVADTTAHEGGASASGTIVGTPAYLAPEAWRGAVVDARSDVFALCVSAYEALAGQRPFVAGSLAQLSQIMGGPGAGVPELGRGVPRRLRRLIGRGLSWTPAQRPGVGELIAAMAPSRPVRRIALAGTSLALSGAVAGRWLATDRVEVRDTPWEPHAQCAAKVDPALGKAAAAHLDAIAQQHPEVAEEFSTAGARFMADWSAARQRICAIPIRDADTRDLVDLRLRCLSLRWGAFAKVLARAGEAQIEPAVQLRRWPELQRCEDPNLGVMWPVPADGNREAVTALWGELDGLQDRQMAGEVAQVDAVLPALIEQIRGTNSQALLAEALYVQGSGAQILGRVEQARAALLEGARAAVAAGYDATAVMSWNSLTYLSIEVQPDLERAEEYVGYAHAALARIADLPIAASQRVTTLYHEALLRLRQLRWTEARKVIDRGLASARQDAPEYTSAFQELLAILLADQGELVEALQVAREVLRTRQATLAPDHFSLGYTHQLLAGILAPMDDLDGALEQIRQARSLTERAMGPSNAPVSGYWQQEATILFEAGRDEEGMRALARAEQAIENQERDDAWEATQLALYTTAALHAHESRAALRYATRHVEVARRVDPQGVSEQWQARSGLTRALTAARQHTAAVREARAWLAARHAVTLSADDMARCDLSAADALFQGGYLREALEVISLALAPSAVGVVGPRMRGELEALGSRMQPR